MPMTTQTSIEASGTYQLCYVMIPELREHNHATVSVRTARAANAECCFSEEVSPSEWATGGEDAYKLMIEVVAAMEATQLLLGPVAWTRLCKMAVMVTMDAPDGVMAAWADRMLPLALNAHALMCRRFVTQRRASAACAAEAEMAARHIGCLHAWYRRTARAPSAGNTLLLIEDICAGTPRLACTAASSARAMRTVQEFDIPLKLIELAEYLGKHLRTLGDEGVEFANFFMNEDMWVFSPPRQTPDRDSDRASGP